MHAYTQTRSRRERASKRRLGPSESVYGVWHSWPTLILYSLSVSSGWCVVCACVPNVYYGVCDDIKVRIVRIGCFGFFELSCCCCTHTPKRRRFVDTGGQTTPKTSYAHSNHSAFTHVTTQSENGFATQLKGKKRDNIDERQQMPTKANNVLARSRRFGPEIVCRIAATIKTNLTALSQNLTRKFCVLWQMFRPTHCIPSGVCLPLRLPLYGCFVQMRVCQSNENWAHELEAKVE